MWVACNSTGCVCVLKFAQKPENAKEMLTLEANIWKKVWQLPARVEIWGSNFALVMPFVLPATSSSFWGTEAGNKAVVDAVTNIAECGWIHKDLKPQHVGFYQISHNLRAVLFDLAKVDKVKNTINAITEMLSTLKL